ncbi:MAG: hypothetical protein HGJ98_05875 [Desulfosporosinus sp.]|nr:hypothetical protein [Desulfosporosinus sp.]MBC2726011.1 hypothetical protein [Desulfosporosinus sp.]
MNDEKQKIFQKLKQLLSTYVPPLVITRDEGERFDLYGGKNVIIDGRMYEQVYFASTIIWKHHVGFYFFPVYSHREKFLDTLDRLMKLLKGKSCFHLKKYDDSIFVDIETILEKGFQIYVDEGWV